MSKTIPLALQTEMSKSTARLATCICIERRDGNVYGFTTNRKSMLIDGLEYRPGSSFTPTDVASGGDMGPDDVQVDALLSQSGLTADELRAGRWDYAEFRMFMVSWANPSAGKNKLRAGRLGEVKAGRQMFVAELIGMMDAYSTSIGEPTQAGCRNVLGDEKCGVVLAGSPLYTVTGSVDGCSDSRYILTLNSRTEDAGTFDRGMITFTSGDAINLSFEVKTYMVGEVELLTPVPYDVTTDSYSMVRGCRGRFIEDCVEVFGNGRRFNGEPWLRGNDAMVQVGRHLD
jgi:uncharacterized phage protein (TIGR02218 family)